MVFDALKDSHSLRGVFLAITIITELPECKQLEVRVESETSDFRLLDRLFRVVMTLCEGLFRRVTLYVNVRDGLSESDQELAVGVTVDGFFSKALIAE